MNPTTGSFTIDPRLQRHFVIMGVNFPDIDNIRKICTTLLEGHFGLQFSTGMMRIIPKIVTSILDIHKKVSMTFLPTAIKFHYQFNLREIANIMGGLQEATIEQVKSPLAMVRMWRHESLRVY
jgi:dynein heavy chain